MPNASATISIPLSDTLTSRLTFRLHVDSAGDKLPEGLEIVVSMNGTGSFAQGHDAKQVRRAPDAEGNAEVVWYRRGIFGRAINATLEAEATDPSLEVTFEPVENQSSESNWISYAQPSRPRIRM